MVKRASGKAGRWTEITLDGRGKAIEVKAPREDVAGSVNYTTTKYEYDQVGNRTKVIRLEWGDISSIRPEKGAR